MRWSNFVLWLELLTAGVAVAAACTLAGGASGARCKTTPCDYFRNGVAYKGTCGTKKHDNKNCYCILDSNKKILQYQTGCALPAE